MNTSFQQKLLDFAQHWHVISQPRKALQYYGSFATGVYLALIAVCFFWIVSFGAKRAKSVSERRLIGLWDLGFVLLLLWICPKVGGWLGRHIAQDPWHMFAAYPAALFVSAGASLLYLRHMKGQKAHPQAGKIGFFALTAVLLVGNVAQPYRFDIQNFGAGLNGARVSADSIETADVLSPGKVLLPRRMTGELPKLAHDGIEILELGRIVDDTDYEEVFSIAQGNDCDMVVVTKKAQTLSELEPEAFLTYAEEMGYAGPVKAGECTLFYRIPPEENAEE